MLKGKVTVDDEGILMMKRDFQMLENGEELNEAFDLSDPSVAVIKKELLHNIKRNADLIEQKRADYDIKRMTLEEEIARFLA